ncbi:MAG: RHS repeat-associated core domain-containing protein, partial [Bacteroides sp.]|nr:RHS repeat-associated core domain-containing protein [Bacteroides sp.]
RQINGTTRYAYDALNQLTKVQYPSYTEELYYDKAGNRIRRMAKGVEELYQYDPGNRLTGYTKGGVTTQFTYDKAGKLLKDNKAEYTYDAFNRTEKVETFDGHVQINRYDAEGLRHEMEEDGKLVQFIFRGDEVVTEETENKVIRFIRGYDLIASDAESARTYYHYASDEMSSITHVVEETNVLNHYEYDAWGNTTVCEETVENRFRFNGQQLDPVTQQYYLRARFYNPVIARFTQEDTYRGDGLNLYAYCANNPVYYVDPSGHNPDCVTKKANAYMEQGVPKEIAYRKAYADLINQKLQNPDLSPAQKQMLLDKLSKTTDMSRISDTTLVEAANAIHQAQYGDSRRDYYYRPVSVTITSDGKVVVTKNNGVIGPKSRDAARTIFGDDVIIPKGRGQNYDNTKWKDTAGTPIVTAGPKHAEARGFQAVLSRFGEDALSGARQATTKPSCPKCKKLYDKWNEYFKSEGMSEIINLTGYR